MDDDDKTIFGGVIITMGCLAMLYAIPFAFACFGLLLVSLR